MRKAPEIPKANPLGIFIVAEKFRFLTKLGTLIPDIAKTDLFDKYVPLLKSVVDEKLNAPTAILVWSTFSLEAYFKYLIRMERKSYKRRHYLDELFRLWGKTYVYASRTIFTTILRS